MKLPTAIHHCHARQIDSPGFIEPSLAVIRSVTNLDFAVDDFDQPLVPALQHGGLVRTEHARQTLLEF